MKSAEIKCLLKWLIYDDTKTEKSVLLPQKVAKRAFEHVLIASMKL